MRWIARLGVGRGGILAAMGWNPAQIVAFCPYIKSPGGHYDDGRAAKTFIPSRIGWLPMDTSHIAEHAGAAGSFFASIFVVATLSMRTMIPLRVFGILTNVIMIASAIPSHNYE